VEHGVASECAALPDVHGVHRDLERVLGKLAQQVARVQEDELLALAIEGSGFSRNPAWPYRTRANGIVSK
jgi:hypothetical protein